MWQLNRSTRACTKNSCASSTRRWERPTVPESFCLINQLSYAEFKLHVYPYIFLFISRTQLKWSKQFHILTQAFATIFIRKHLSAGSVETVFFLWLHGSPTYCKIPSHCHPEPAGFGVWFFGFFCFSNLKQTPSSIPGKLRFFYTAMSRLPVSRSLYLSTK